MSTLKLSLVITPDAKAVAILDAFCESRNYDPALGRTKLQFLQDEIIEFLRTPYIEKTRRALTQTANVTIKNDLAAITMTYE